MAYLMDGMTESERVFSAIWLPNEERKCAIYTIDFTNMVFYAFTRGLWWKFEMRRDDLGTDQIEDTAHRIKGEIEAGTAMQVKSPDKDYEAHKLQWAGRWYADVERLGGEVNDRRFVVHRVPVDTAF